MKRNTKTRTAKTPTTFSLDAYDAMLERVGSFRIIVEAISEDGKVLDKQQLANATTVHRTSDAGTEILYTSGKLSVLGQPQQCGINFYAVGSKAAAAARAKKAARKAVAEADRQ